MVSRRPASVRSSRSARAALPLPPPLSQSIEDASLLIRQGGVLLSQRARTFAMGRLTQGMRSAHIDELYPFAIDVIAVCQDFLSC